MADLSRPSLSPRRKWLLRITGLFSLLLFLTPAGFVLKYNLLDRPREEARAQMPLPAGYSVLASRDPDNIAVQAKVAKGDPDPQRRREAVQGLGETARAPGVAWRRPMETLTAKATLAEIATRDQDPAVRAAASDALGKIAQGGAVIRR